MSERNPSGTTAHLAMVNLAGSDRQPDDWRTAIIEPPARHGRYDPTFFRGLCIAIPLSGALWGALFGLWRLCVG